MEDVEKQNFSFNASVNSSNAQREFVNFALPGAGHLPTPGPFPSFWHACSFLSEYNYTHGFTGKKADWHICQGQE